MNVLVLTSQFYAPSGAEGLQIEFALELASRSGVSVTLMALGDPHDPKVSLAKSKLEAKGLRVEILKLQLHPSLWSLWSAARRLRKWIVCEEVDVVETGLYTPSIVAALATQGLKIPLIHGVHAPFYRDMKLGRWNLRKHFWRLGLRGENVFFYSISDFVGQCWAGFFGISSNRIRRIYNSIAAHHFSAENSRGSLYKELGIDAGEKLILFVGRIRRDKGVEILLDAVANDLIELHAHLIFIGAVEPEYADLGERIKELSLRNDSRIHHLGYRNDVATWFASVDVFVLPTQREGFGMVIMEALAAGCPTVATTVDALPEIFGESGAILVAPQDTSALRKAISRQLALDLNQRKALAGRGRCFASQFTTVRRADELLKYLQTCQRQM